MLLLSAHPKKHLIEPSLAENDAYILNNHQFKAGGFKSSAESTGTGLKPVLKGGHPLKSKSSEKTPLPSKK